MKVLVFSVLVLLVVVPLAMWSGASGSFAGTVVTGPEQSDTWVYVQGHNHRVRRVYVSGAKIAYDADVPVAQRQNPVPKAFLPGMRIRVTAEQDDAGEWRATEIETLKPDSPADDKKSAAPTISQSRYTSN